jgi:hypothetical protein
MPSLPYGRVPLTKYHLWNKSWWQSPGTIYRDIPSLYPTKEEEKSHPRGLWLNLPNTRPLSHLLSAHAFTTHASLPITYHTICYIKNIIHYPHLPRLFLWTVERVFVFVDILRYRSADSKKKKAILKPCIEVRAAHIVFDM